MRVGAAGLYCVVAAVELLIGHERWLHRDDFVAEFVEFVPGLADGTPMAFIDWRRVVSALADGRLPCSSGEGQLLRLCASLAEGVVVDLSEALTSLDPPTVSLVAQAVLRAGGLPAPVGRGGEGASR
ncbi:hypothetical protein ABZ468_55545 [Streptomyces sp. NPDC005708]|uniref:hypothetical protein n=1 Tax=Streptomyces sp. NPDC005708 TaxID=3154564 RepID=UPI0033C276C1